MLPLTAAVATLLSLELGVTAPVLLVEIVQSAVSVLVFNVTLEGLTVNVGSA